MLHPNLEGTVREFFAGIRSLGIASQGAAFLVGWAFGWALLWIRKKLKIG